MKNGYISSSMARTHGAGDDGGRKILVVNKKARFDYHILECFEAGIMLTGPEIKSVRAGKISLGESYVRPTSSALFLYNANIARYTHDTDPSYDPLRPRKLLVNKREIDRLRGRVEQKGLTIVPLQLYLKRGWAKLEIALAKGKDAPDKRQNTKDRELKRELDRVRKQQ